MKINIKESPLETKINDQKYGFVQFNYCGVWELGLICYLNSQSKQLILVREPETTWTGNSFQFREVKGTITISEL